MGSDDYTGIPTERVNDVRITPASPICSSRLPDYAAENRALSTLADALANRPEDVIHLVAQLAIELCRADSAGVTVLERSRGNDAFRWLAAAGDFAPNLGHTMPAQGNPCGVVVARNEILTYRDNERSVSGIRELEPHVSENLLAPWSIRQIPAGALWVARHTREEPFDTDDARVLITLAQFASAAYRTGTALESVQAGQQSPEQRVVEEGTRERRESEEKYRTLFETMDEGFALCELVREPGGRAVDYRYLEVNRALLSAKGLQRGDVVGRFRSEVYGPPYGSWLDVYARVVETGAPAHIKDYGTWLGHWYDVRCYPRGGDRFALLYDDITERKRHEDHHAFVSEISRELVGLNSISETMDRIGSIIGQYFSVTHCLFSELTHDFETLITPYAWNDDGAPSLNDVNRMPNYVLNRQLAAEITGEPAIVIDTHTDMRVNPETCAAIGVRSFIITPVVREGRCIFQLSILDNRPRQWRPDEIALVREIAERIWTRLERARAEEALRESEQRYRRLFERIGEGFIEFELVFDDNAEVVDVRYRDANQAYVKLTGIRTDDLVGRLGSQIHPRDFDRWLPLYRRVAAGESIRVEYYNPDRDRWYDVGLSPDGPDRAICLYNDITERKRTEAILRQTDARHAFLLKLSDALRPLGDTAAIQREACRLLGEQLGASRAYYVEFYESRDSAVVGQDYVCGGLPSVVGEYRLSDFRWAVPLYKIGNPVIVQDVRKSHLIPDLDREPLISMQVIAWIAVPLVKHGELAGALCVDQVKSREWTETDIDLTRETAERIWAAMGRARAEKRLREAELRFRTMADAAPVLIWETDETGVVFVNAHYLEFFGMDLATARGKSWPYSLHPEDKEAYLTAYQTAFEGRQPFAHECRFRRADGEYRWLHNIGRPLGARRFVGCSLDITDLQAAQIALRQSEERFRLFVENVQEYALFQTDTTGKVTSWNPGAERLFGYTSAEMLGQNASRLLTPEDEEAEVLVEELSRATSGQRHEDARWLVRRDGSRFWALYVTEPVLDQVGSLRGIARILRDETERQHADQVIRISLAEKEALLKEVHHRVKNNLQVIISMVNLQAHQISDDRVLAVFDEMRNRVYSIAAIHELLYRSESFSEVSLLDYARHLADEVVRFYRPEGQIRVEVRGEAVCLELQRAVPFGLLLNELVSNVCKHAFPSGRPGTLTITVQQRDHAIVLTVSDDGIGLPSGFNSDESACLGLRLVHLLARQLGGSVTAQSGAGTQVQVSFPKKLVEEGS